MMSEMCGVWEVETAETNWAPALMMRERSARRPTMKPETLWRKINGVGVEGEDWEGVLARRMNWVALRASGVWMTGWALAMMPHFIPLVC